MRNFIILAAALGLTGVAQAQSSATVDQTGTSNDATVTQSGGATIDITQGDNANEATATQVGASTATVVQSSTAQPNSTGGHEVTIQQIGGDGNFIDFRQSFGTGGQGPKGAHTADLFQDGNDNRISGAADVSEADGFDPAFQNSRSDLDAEVDQIGDRNVTEFSNGNPLSVLQQGDDNYALANGGASDIDQIGDFNDAQNRGASATIYQEGDQNDASVQGGFAGSRHTVDINQLGDFNLAQASGDPRGGSTTVDQDGDYNSATMDYGNAGNRDASGVDYDVTQDAGAFGAMGASNSFDATVRGQNNTATISQTLTAAGANSITLSQLSDGNTATLSQTGSGNTQTVTQQ